jgi:hypothetical protein
MCGEDDTADSEVWENSIEVLKFDSTVEARNQKKKKIQHIVYYILFLGMSLHKGGSNIFYFNILPKNMTLSLVSKKGPSERREKSSIRTYVPSRRVAVRAY